MKHNPLISIISVNYKQEQATIDFLESLKYLTYNNIEVILVDNAVNKDNSKIFRDVFPDLIYIHSTENLGFAGGNNLGLKDAHGEFIFFLNNDTEVTPGCIEPIMELFESDSKIGLISPLIKFHWQQDLIQYAGFTEMNKVTLRNNAIGYKENDSGQYKKPQKTFFAHGAAMMVKREILDKIGSMSEKFFLYYEEHDWCERIRKEGYTIYFQPQSTIYHKESLATGEDSHFKLYYINRNRILFARRNFSLGQYLVFITYYISVPFVRDILKYGLKGKLKHIGASCRALIWNFTHYNIYG